MVFDFSEAAGKAQSSSKPLLEGNKIHTVKFLGCERRTIQGKKDPNATYDVLEIKFENEKGTFTHTIWALTDESKYKDSISPNGIKNPSEATTVKYLFFHLLKAINPELSAKIESGEKKLPFKPGTPAEIWEQLCQVFIKATESSKGKETQIKLLMNKKGDAIFPYFLNYSKEGEIYMSTNFIGENLGFTAKEKTYISKMQSAAPTKPSASDGLAIDDTDNEAADESLNFDL